MNLLLSNWGVLEAPMQTVTAGSAAVSEAVTALLPLKVKTGSGSAVVLLSVMMLKPFFVSLPLCIILYTLMCHVDLCVSFICRRWALTVLPSHSSTPTHVDINLNSFTFVLLKTLHFTDHINILTLKQVLNRTNLHWLLEEVKTDQDEFMWSFGLI